MYYNFPKDYLIPVINDYINKDTKGFRFKEEFENLEDEYINCEENEKIEYYDDEYAKMCTEKVNEL